MQLTYFLKLVLPQDGKKCWVSLKKGTPPQQGFVNTFEELAVKLLKISASGRDAYFGCASYKDASSRKGSNTLYLLSVWADVDCGPKKPYPDAAAGLTALDAFCDKRALPYPQVIYSGWGIHAYWVFSAPITAEQWLPIGKALKHTAQLEGFHIDQTRTADPASILRPPETYNYKKEPRLVEARDDEIEIISAEEFAAKLEISAQSVVARDTPRTVTCAVSNAILGGRAKSLDSPVLEGGRNTACAAYVGSLLPRGMTYGQVLQEARAWNERNCMPPMDDAEVQSVVRSISKREAEKPAPAPMETAVQRNRPELPAGYSAKPNGAMFAIVETENGPKPHPMSAYECYLVDVCRREREAKGSYIFAQYHPHNGWHEFSVATKDFYSAQAESIMADNHADIINFKLFKQYVRTAAIAMKGEKMDAIRYEQFGWKDNLDAFLVGDSLIKKGGGVEFAYGDAHLEPRMRHMRLSPGTSLAEWTALANRYYAPGFEAFGVGLLAGFAAPLMQLVGGATEGGAVLSLYSDDSGFGKSNILQGIASIWGQWAGLNVGGLDTVNAKFSIISRLCHIVICEEELGKFDPVKGAEYVKRFVAGRDKNRARRDGSVAANDSHFQTIMVSASNHSLYDIVKQSGDQGALARILELEVMAPVDKQAFKEYTKIANGMLHNSGHAGRHFIFSIMQPGWLEYVLKRLDALVVEYQNLLASTGKDRYITYLLATMHMAAEIANATGLLSFDRKRIMDWMLARAQARVADRVANTPVEMLNQFIMENSMNCLTMQEPFNAQRANVVLRMPAQKLVMRMEKSSSRLYIPTQSLRDWCAAKGYNFTRIQRDLEETNVILNRNRLTTMSAGTDFTPTRVLCWEVAMDCVAMRGGISIVAGTGAPKLKI